MKQVSNDILKRIYLLFGLFLLFGVAVLLRVASLQVNQAAWVQREMDKKIFFKKMIADRGNILAEDGSILATSIPFYRIAMDPSRLDTSLFLNFSDSLMVLAANLADHFGGEEKDTMQYYHRVYNAIASGDKHVYLTRKKINFRELEMVKSWPIARLNPYEGGLLEEKFENERYYPMGDLARITLGRLVDDTLGIRGIEAAFNPELRGRDSYILAQRVVGKSYVPLDQYGDSQAKDGFDIRTTLDVDMQDVVETALARGVENNYAKFGVAILMEVETGAVKAIANYPEDYNYALAFQYEPGSTFKTAAATALLEDGLVRMCDTLNTGNGELTFDDKVITDNGAAYGLLDFEQAFSRSSNVFMALATNNNYENIPERYIWHLKNFGFGEASFRQFDGIPTPRMIEPTDTSEWTIATLPSLAYGYSVMVTPLQMATFYNGLANRGKLVRPWLVKEIRNDAQVIQRYAPEIINESMCSEETADQMRELMKGVVDRYYGTAYKAMKGLPFEVAGKTGTVRINENGRYVRKYRASFGGFFPADNPRFTLFVMVSDPNGGTSGGGTVAAPIFRDIARDIYKLDQGLARPPANPDPKARKQPIDGAVFAQTAEIVYPQLGVTASGIPDAEWLETESNGHQVNLQELITEDRVPDLKGMSARDAIHLLENMGVKVRLQGIGRVRRQSLLPGYRVQQGAQITLFCS
ncbi:MAG: penicillin-binding protein [Bacteroidota bacterium]